MKDIRIHFDKYNLFEIFLGALLIFVLWSIGKLLLIFGVALIISAFIEDFVQVTQRYRIPRIVSVLGFYLIAFLVFGLALLFIIPVFTKEISGLIEVYPEIQNFINVNNFLISTGDSITVSSVIDQLQDEEVRIQIFSSILSFFGGIVNFLFIFIISFYLSIQEGVISRFLRIFTPLKYEEKVINIWQRVQKKIGSWFRSQLIMALILFILTYAFLSLLGIPYAFVLSFLTAIVEFIPYGVFAMGSLAVIVGIIHSGLWIGAIIAIFYFALQQVLDLILQPLVVRKLTGVPSLVVILSVLIGAHLFGFYGLLLAVPLALFIMEIIADSEKTKAEKRALENNEENSQEMMNN